MRIVYFGTPSFAAEILKELVSNNVEIAAVVTKPDRPKGRSLKLLPSEVKAVSTELLPDVLLLQPDKCSTPEFAQVLRKLNADIFVVVGYGEILKEEILSISPLGCINVHASLLPLLRGAAPIQRALMSGMKESGVTIIKLVQKMDAGDILLSESVPIDLNTTFPGLESRLCDVGAKTLLQVLDQFKKYEVNSLPQNHELATFASKVTTEECQIDWRRPAIEIHNLIRAVTPHPGAFCHVRIGSDTKRLKILLSEYVSESKNSLKPGSIIESSDKKELFVACGEGTIRCIRLQLEGKKELDASQFLVGIDRNSLSLL